MSGPPARPRSGRSGSRLRRQDIVNGVWTGEAPIHAPSLRRTCVVPGGTGPEHRLTAIRSGLFCLSVSFPVLSSGNRRSHSNGPAGGLSDSRHDPVPGSAEGPLHSPAASRRSRPAENRTIRQEARLLDLVSPGHLCYIENNEGPRTRTEMRCIP